jgi:fucose 4-O-acetylase-like acetyltransferase
MATGIMHLHQLVQQVSFQKQVEQLNILLSLVAAVAVIRTLVVVVLVDF